ncbi:MAG: AAA domain-containing protein, partial [Propioniciclava sp.]
MTTKAGPKQYSFKPGRVTLLTDPTPCPPPSDALVEVCGRVCRHVSEMLTFSGPSGAWTRVFYQTRTGERYRTFPAAEVRVLTDAAQAPRAQAILGYWRDLVAHLPPLKGDPDPLKATFRTLDRVHPESALAHYLSAAPIIADPDTPPPLFPFDSNVSQRQALLQALTYPVSVIDGPPGTGKTQTILNLLATLVATPGTTVGVVSANNAAVDNVRDKFTELGFGYLIANLGNLRRKAAFFAAQAERNAVVDALVASPDPHDPEEPITTEGLQRLSKRIERLQHQQRALAQARQDLRAHELEFAHFTHYLTGHEVNDLDGVTLLSRDSDRILDYLA